MSEISNRPPREQRGRITNPPSKGVLFSRNPEGSQPDYRGGININGIESLATIVKLAKALDVDLVDFFRKP